MASNATLNWVTSTERLPKSASDWILPAAAAATLLVGINLVVKSIPKHDKRPPMVPRWIPWVGNTWQLEADADAFFKSADKKYPGGIVGIVSAGKTAYFVNSSQLINQIYKQPKVYAMSPHQANWMRDVFSVSQRILTETTVFPEHLAPDFHRSISPQHMMPILESFAENLQHLVAKAVLPAPGKSVSLTDFVMKLSYEATGKAVFGPTFDVATFGDFHGFDEYVWKVSLGYPPYLLRSFVNSRERLIQAFARYLEAPHEPSEMIGNMERIGRDNHFSSRDLGVICVCSWWPMMANVPWGTLWTLLFQLQEPNGAQPLIDELDTAGKTFSATHAYFLEPYHKHVVSFLQSGASLPLLNSTFSETLRYVSDAYSLRGVIAPEGAVLGGYEFKLGDTLICNTRRVHMDENEFEHATEWIPTRFMSDEEGKKGKESELKWMPFGGGVSICSGRFFAQYHVRIFIATLLKNLHFEVDYPKSKLPLKLSGINRGFGLRRPDGDLFVKITRI